MDPFFIGIIVLALVIFISMAIKIVTKYERGAIFRLGRFIGVKGPGLFLTIPFVDRMIKVDLRVVTIDISPQEVITSDNVTVKAPAVVHFRVVDPQASVLKVLDHVKATSQTSQTMLRNVLMQSKCNELSSSFSLDRLNRELQRSIDQETRTWGVEVTKVEIKEIPFGEKIRE